MFLNRTTRALVAIVAVLTLLVCEGIWAAQAPLRIAAADAAATGGCHGALTDELPGNAAASPCESAQPPSDPFKLPLIGPIAVPAVARALAEDTSRVDRNTLSLTPLTGAPPPLRVLHCCFRN